MGCDIHFYVERRVDGKWVSADRWTKDKYSDPGEERMTVDCADEFYGQRNYRLFSLLADVRSEPRAVPFSEPRGLPKDLSPQLQAEADRYGEDGHSHSYFTVAELMDQDWTEEQMDARIVEAMPCGLRMEPRESGYSARTVAFP